MIAMYRQQWRQSPEQQREIVRWVEDMVRKKLIHPSISSHTAPTFCVRKPSRMENCSRLPVLELEHGAPEYSDDMEGRHMSGAYWFSRMDLMSANYQVCMREEDIKYTAFQAPNVLCEYLVLPMGVCNAPATMHRSCFVSW
jgi:hypothetical protein